GAARSTGHSVLAVVASAAPGEAETAAKELGRFGAAKVVCLAGAGRWSPDAAARDVARVVQEQQAKAFLAAATATGKDLAPRVAALLDSTLFSDCTGLAAEGDSFRVVRPW